MFFTNTGRVYIERVYELPEGSRASKGRSIKNVLNLQPEGLESVQWQHRLEHDAGANIWSGLVLTTPEDAAGMVDALRAVPEVAGIDGCFVARERNREWCRCARSSLRGLFRVINRGANRMA